LFRIIEPVSGSIYIDSIDITKVGLHDCELFITHYCEIKLELFSVRSNLAIVPQNADLFEGTLRENIDPVELYSDVDIWNALEQVRCISVYIY
jgi:ABC-type multidrug transport system fused ATPase/permease subunit